MLYDEIVKLEEFPNLKGAKILGFCLNVLGLQPGAMGSDRHDRALQTAVLAWTRRNYMLIYESNPLVAAECLVERFSFEIEGPRLVRTYPVENLRREARRVVLELDKPAMGAEFATTAAPA